VDDSLLKSTESGEAFSGTLDQVQTVMAGPEQPPTPVTPAANPATQPAELGEVEVVPPKLAWLGVVSGPGAERGLAFMLGDDTVVGRRVGHWVLGGDPTISSRHFSVRLESRADDPNGEPVYVLYDLGSANGTYVGAPQNYQEEGSRVERCELAQGDYILVGETTLVYLEA